MNSLILLIVQLSIYVAIVIVNVASIIQVVKSLTKKGLRISTEYVIQIVFYNFAINIATLLNNQKNNDLTTYLIVTITIFAAMLGLLFTVLSFHNKNKNIKKEQ